MSIEENERIIIPDENGEEQLYEILFHFDVEENGNSYIITTPVEDSEEPEDEGEDEEIEVFAFRFEEGDNKDDIRLFPIESDEEWKIVEEMFHTLIEEEEE